MHAYIHTYQIKGATIFLLLTSSNADQFSKFFHQQISQWICSKTIIKHHTTPQMHHYTTLWNVCAQKWPCSTAEWSALPCKSQPFETVAEKYSSSDVSTVLLSDKKIFTAVTLKSPKNHQLYATGAIKKKDVMTKLLHTWSTFRQLLMASVGEKTRVWYLSITESRLLRAIIVTWWCCNSYSPPCVRSQSSYSSFSSTVPCAHGTWGSQLS